MRAARWQWLVAALALACACGPAAPRPGEAGPRLSFTFATADGDPVTSRDLRGRVVVLHLFTVGSMAAQVDADKLRALALQYPNRVAVLGVNLDIDGGAFVEPWRRANEVGYPVVLGGSPQAVAAQLGQFEQVPTTIVLDARSRVRARIARQLAPGEVESLVRTSLKPPVH